ncbi:alpha/beta hydrolase [Alloalcanivorax mobilis]|uniref:alpha/beta hydrolase n=1 Tax=Alloalcanivorax mobilis TaxID=2019569 RepID=UPI000C77BE35|nr:alpha/beta hydrolase [Alloalcanivorax mobilis]|tara:strand:- start:30719 stop:31621 length:903 start_codon:yes stop_codon:yes gene_type:complete
MNVQSADNQALKAVIERVRGVYGRWRRDTSVAEMRADWERLFQPREPITPHYFDAKGVPVAWIAAPGADDTRTLIYFHGGGFRVGSVASHAELMLHLSRTAGCRVLGVNYRCTPEYGYPAPVEDGLAVYRFLIEEGIDPARIALAGDSAGANLALNLLLRLRDQSEPLPAGALLMSAWTDLAATGESYESRADADPIHQRPMIQSMAAGYLGAGIAADDAAASPLYASLNGLPPMLLQVGEAETVLDDSRRFVELARDAGNAVELAVYPRMIHVFQQFMHELPEARAALDEAGAFLRRCW